MRFADIEDIFYFGYGHNTDVEEFLRRVPGAKPLGVGVLKNFKFVLKHYADIENQEETECYGVVWKITTRDLKTLDHDEGLHKHYNRIPVEIDLGSKKIRATTYIMDPAYHSSSLPSKKYIKMLATGYKENGVPMSQLVNALEERLEETD